MSHDGYCFQKTKYSSAAAESFEFAAAAEELLINPETGKPRGEDTCCAIGDLVADNDTTGPINAIKRQNEILGSVADGLAEHVPDEGHTAKVQSNELHNKVKEDPTFRGKNALSNLRIKSIAADVKAAIKAYHPNVGDAEERTKCLCQIGCIIRHHCGDHSRCKDEQFCTYIKVKNEHPTWPREQIQEEAANRSKRYRTCMDLSEHGIQVLEQIISKRFNEKTIDKIAKCGSSNACEGFWGQLVKLSEGKRIQGCGTDLWLSMVQLCFCMNGQDNVEKSRRELSRLMNVCFTDVEERACAKMKRKRERDYVRHNCDEGRKRRSLAKLTMAHRQGKDPHKSRHHKSERLPLTKSTKSKVDKCTKCGHVGHKTRDCVVVRAPKKQKKAAFKWGGQVVSTEKYQPRMNKYKPNLYDWSASTLLTKK